MRTLLVVDGIGRGASGRGEGGFLGRPIPGLPSVSRGDAPPDVFPFVLPTLPHSATQVASQHYVGKPDQPPSFPPYVRLPRV